MTFTTWAFYYLGNGRPTSTDPADAIKGHINPATVTDRVREGERLGDAQRVGVPPERLTRCRSATPWRNVRSPAQGPASPLSACIQASASPRRIDAFPKNAIPHYGINVHGTEGNRLFHQNRSGGPRRLSPEGCCPQRSDSPPRHYWHGRPTPAQFQLGSGLPDLQREDSR